MVSQAASLGSRLKLNPALHTLHVLPQSYRKSLCAATTFGYPKKIPMVTPKRLVKRLNEQIFNS